VTVEVINGQLTCRKLVHWHGLFIPPEVGRGRGGSATPMVPPHGRIRYQFIPAAGRDRVGITPIRWLGAGPSTEAPYTGPVRIPLYRGRQNYPGNFDKEFFLAPARGGEPFFQSRKGRTMMRMRVTPDRSRKRPKTAGYPARRVWRSAIRCSRINDKSHGRQESRFALRQGAKRVVDAPVECERQHEIGA